MVDGYDWVRPADDKTMALRRELTEGAINQTGILATSPLAAEWLDGMTARAKDWLARVNTTAEADVTFKTNQLPLRRGDFVAWKEEAAAEEEEKEEEQERGLTRTARSRPITTRGVGMVVTCCADAVAVHRLAESGSASTRTSEGRAMLAPRLTTATPPAKEWIDRADLHRADVLHLDRWEESHDGRAAARLPADWEPVDWHVPNPPTPTPTCLRPKLPALAPIVRPAAGQPPQERLEVAREAVRLANAGPSLRDQVAAIREREKAASALDMATAEPAHHCSPCPPPDQQEAEPERINAYSDGSFQYSGTAPTATWAVVRADMSQEKSPREDQMWGGRLTGPRDIIGIDRAELWGLSVLLNDGSVARGGGGVDVGHVDRKSTLDTTARLANISRSDFLQLDHRDIWEGVQLWTGHLKGRHELVKVAAHVDKLRPPRERTEHEWGNHAADKRAEVAMTAPALDPIAALQPPPLRDRTSRYRMYGADGVELTGGLNKVVWARCAERSRQSYRAQREEGGHKPIASIDPRLQVYASNAERRVIIGPCVEVVGKGDGEVSTQTAWWSLTAGRGGGGTRARQAQLCKFLSKRLPTQHIKERYGGGQAVAGHSACVLCGASDCRADNDHLLFACTHVEIIAARRLWVGMIRDKWESEVRGLPRRFVAAALGFWQVTQEGTLTGWQPLPPPPVTPDEMIGLLPYMGERWGKIAGGGAWNPCRVCEREGEAIRLYCEWCSTSVHLSCSGIAHEEDKDWACEECKEDARRTRLLEETNSTTEVAESSEEDLSAEDDGRGGADQGHAERRPPPHPQ